MKAGNTVPVVYLGFDSREPRAYEVAEFTIRRSARGPVHIIPVMLARLEQQGLMRRPREMRPLHVARADRNIMWDVISDAPMATEFAISRFAVPLLAQTGFAIFMDSDIVCYGDVYDLVEQAQWQDHFAVWCVQHRHETGVDSKMDGQRQVYYRRKNWSSVMVFNCDHPSNLYLGMANINTQPGRTLHGFEWLNERQIGALDPEWNWLVGVTERPAAPKISHFTLGGPWLPNWEPKEHDDEWLAAEKDSGPVSVPGDAAAGKAPV